MNYEEFHKRFTEAVESQDFSHTSEDLKRFFSNSRLVIQNTQALDYLIWLTEVLIQHNQLAQADMVLAITSSAVEQGGELFAQESQRLSKIFNLCGQVQYQLGNYSKAKNWCQSLKRHCQKSYGKKSSEVMDALTKLALTNEAVNDLSEAARHYDEALVLARDLLPGKDPFKMWILAKLKQVVELGELCTVCYRRLPDASLSCAFCTQKGIPAMNASLFKGDD